MIKFMSNRFKAGAAAPFLCFFDLFWHWRTLPEANELKLVHFIKDGLKFVERF